jgi:hypothetical protein
MPQLMYLQISLGILGPVTVKRSNSFTQTVNNNGPGNKVFKYSIVEGRNKQKYPLLTRRIY